jgi:hypothetical protein
MDRQRRCGSSKANAALQLAQDELRAVSSVSEKEKAQRLALLEIDLEKGS